MLIFNALILTLLLSSLTLLPLQAEEVEPQTAQATQVVMSTTQGDITFELMPDIAPKTCENFLGLIEKNYYDGIIFHRIIPEFMIQGGDPTGTGRGGHSIWGNSFEDEFSEEVDFNSPGLLAMANSGPNTNGSQFFITTVPTPWLHMRHTIFGRVIKGSDVVEAIESMGSPSGRPIEEQKINSVKIVK